MEINRISIYNSKTHTGRNITVSDIERDCRQSGLNGIGYHYVIGLNGEQFKCVNIASNVKDSDVIKICYIGGVASDGRTQTDTRTEKQKASMADLIAELQKEYPDAEVTDETQIY